MYSLKDMMLGAELKLKYNRLIDDIVFEYIYTKYQSGLFTTTTPAISPTISAVWTTITTTIYSQGGNIGVR